MLAVTQLVTLMCILAIQFQTAQDAPVLIAQNREEFYDRPTQPPRIQSGRPRAVCGIDRKAGGTWFGVNQHGLVVAVANGFKKSMPPEPRSRGLLCRELLTCTSAQEAVDHAVKELHSGAYAGVYFLCADSNSAALVHGSDEVTVTPITPGLHLLTNSGLDNPNDERQQYARRLLTLQRLDSSVAFLAVASRAFSRKADGPNRRGLIVTSEDYGTVSSTLLALPTKLQNAVYHYAPGPPSDVPYDDYSALLRQVLSTDR